MVFDWSNIVSVIWFWCECIVGGLLVLWFLLGGLICDCGIIGCCYVYFVYLINLYSMLLYICICSLFNKLIFDVVKLLILIVFSYVLLLDFVCRNDSYILLGFLKINV